MRDNVCLTCRRQGGRAICLSDPCWFVSSKLMPLIREEQCQDCEGPASFTVMEGLNVESMDLCVACALRRGFTIPLRVMLGRAQQEDSR